MIFSEMTAPGRGGISTIAVLVAGVERESCGALFRPSVPGKSGSINYRHMIDASGATIDEVIVGVECLRASDGQLVEIHCHGGPASVAGICGRLTEAGYRRVGWRELLDAAGCGRGESAVMRAADAALVDLPTMAAVELVLRQRDGAFERGVRELLGHLSEGRLAAAEAGIAGLLERWRRCGRWLAGGARVAIIGAPNVGKSSLMNALAGHERVIVDESPGTTRDVVGERVLLGGVAVELLDTAGLRDSADEVEREGVQRALEESRGADVRLCLVDLSRGLTAAERGMIEMEIGRAHV